MTIPFLDLKAQYHSIKDEIQPELAKVLDNTAYILGKPVAEFEQAFATAQEAKYCSCVSTGTAGNHMVLWALGVKQGDEVILPANTFIATAWGATLCGATPVFVDCKEESYTIDPQKITEAITEKTKAIVAVHLYGQAANLDAIKEALLAVGYLEKATGTFYNEEKKHELFLVEDCAQSHLAEYKGKRVGGLTKASSFSFYPGKNLGAYGEGGAVMTNDAVLAKTFRMIRDHGAEQKYNHQIYGHNYRMEGLQGAVLGVKLKHLDTWTNGRRKVAARYKELLEDIDGIILPSEMEYAKHVYHLFVIQVKSKQSEVRTQRRDDLQKYLTEQGIATGLHYPIPLHQQPCFEHLGYKKGAFPVSEKLAEQGLSLPMYAEMNDEQIHYIGNKIKQFFGV